MTVKELRELHGNNFQERFLIEIALQIAELHETVKHFIDEQKKLQKTDEVKKMTQRTALVEK